jgi:trans-aconitate methyltransferase
LTDSEKAAFLGADVRQFETQRWQAFTRVDQHVIGAVHAYHVRLREAFGYYYELLSKHCSTVDVWRTTYLHPLADHAAVVEWFKASALRPFLAPLTDSEKAAFLQEYHARISQAYPALADGTVLLPFPRLFIIATR